MKDLIVDTTLTKQFVQDLLARYGADSREAHILTDALIWCDARGAPSQGLCRIPQIVKRLEAGGIVSPCRPKIRQTGAVTESMDGKVGCGQVLAWTAMRRAIELAPRESVTVVMVRNSNHLGAAGCYADMAAQEGMVAIVMSNAFPTVAAFGGLKPVLGTNPLAFVVPRKNGESIIVDMGTTFGSRTATIDRARKRGAIAEGLVVGGHGVSVTDGHKSNEVTLLPLSARGFALGLIVEILAGVLTGSGYAGELRSFYHEPAKP